MSPILPVIDLQEGLVVRGVAGERDRYRPIESAIAPEPSPAAVAEAFHHLGYRDAYIADLDAIAGQAPAWEDYRSVLAHELHMWIDAGITGLDRALQLTHWFAKNAEHPASHHLVIGLENLQHTAELRRITEEIDPARLVFSIDLKNGHPLAAAKCWREADPLAIARDVLRTGVRKLIILDLACVGVGQGTGTEELCRQIKTRWPEVELIGGGGVNSREEVKHLVAGGLSRVLVASALHNGRIR